MNNNFDKFQFPNIFDINSSNSQHHFHIPKTHQHTLPHPNHHQNPYPIKYNDQNQAKDDRTQDQVMNNLSFSIQDLLSKITKVRQQYQAPPIKKVTQKKQQPLSFKLSNLSNSTQSNSNHSRSDRYIEKYQNQLNSGRNRGSQPRKQVLTNSERNVKIVLPQSSSKFSNSQNNSEAVKQIKSLLSSVDNPTLEELPQMQRKSHSQSLPFGNVLSSQKPFGQTNYAFGKAPSFGNQTIHHNQNSAFGKAPELLRVSQKANHRIIKQSIIIQDEDSKKGSSYEELQIEQSKRMNSLFDGKGIRQVAASTIFESPDKNKKSMIKMHNPFLDIVGKNDIIVESKIIETHKASQSGPIIKINGVQNKNLIRQQPKLSIRDFHLGKQLGSGKFGDVYQAIHKQTGMLYAIKKIFKSTILQYNMIEQFTRQLKIHYMLDYPNIIKLYTHFDDQYHIFLVMEYGEGGMLMERLKTGEKFASNIVEQMLRAVEYLQNKKIAHRDIKPENIVMMFGDTAKLCDFGWSRVFDSDMKKTFCGTLDYVSPEMKDIGQYSVKIDIWSLGVLTFQIICGYAPFKNQINNWKLKGGNLNQKWNWNIIYPPEVSSVAQSFMRNLLKQNPNQRANIRFCMNHLFIRKYNQMSFDQDQDKRFRQIGPVLGA